MHKRFVVCKPPYRDYVVRKYVRARSALEAIELSEAAPVIEVNEMKDRPDTTNPDLNTNAVGFQKVTNE
jgi:hypothetical protein